MFSFNSPSLGPVLRIMISTWSTAVTLAILYMTAGISISHTFSHSACESVLFFFSVLRSEMCGIHNSPVNLQAMCQGITNVK